MRDTIDMAREAGMDVAELTSGWGPIITAEPADLERFEALVRADAIADERSGAEERFNALLDDYCTALETIGDMRSEDEVNGNIIECHEATIKRLEAKILAEREKFKHNEEVLMNALWKACGDDEEVVNATIESQGELK